MKVVNIKDLDQFENQEVELRGWVYNIRSIGKIWFVILRDGTGLLQGVVVKGEASDETFLLEHELKDYELFVVHDDIDLGFGRFRIKKSSSDGGHNGIKSIDLAIGNNDYWRFKVGVGRPPSTKDPAEYVLSKFNSDETEEVEFIIEDSMEIIDLFLKDVESAIKTASERRIIDVV